MPPIGPSPAIPISGSLRWWVDPVNDGERRTPQFIVEAAGNEPTGDGFAVGFALERPGGRGACGAILGEGLVQALDDIAPLAQVTQALLRVSCEDPARWPRRLGETQPLEVAHSPAPDLPQRIARGSPIRPKFNDPIRRPRFPGQHPIEACPAFGRHFPFEALAHLS